ncbi:MAG: two-component sensor histidine kinase [Hyphomicrobiales bacterium]|nr:two-component sensor histidine kinase [Hyphomicrobiales bacterium]
MGVDSKAAPGVVDALIEALPEAVFVVASDLDVVAANRIALRTLPALRVGEPLLRGLRAPDVLDAAAEVFTTGQPQNALWLDRVPVERQFEIYLNPASFDAARVCVVTLHDVTEARRLDQTRTDFVANASHELRTPLASVLGFIDTLQGPAKDDLAAREKFLAIMGEQARRMARLVDDLLSLSRIEQNLHMRPDKEVDLVSIAGQMVDGLRAMAEEAGVEIRFAPHAPVIVLGDRDELLRVAENLIENAIKYGAPSPVDVSVDARDGMGRLVVVDRGPGVAAEHLPRLTERFYRVDVGQSRAKGGTGLGLSLVKHILARHRGRLSIESAPGQGSTFAAVVPLAR